MDLKEAFEELELDICKAKEFSINDIENIFEKLLKKYQLEEKNDIPDYLKKLISDKLKK